MKYSEDAVSDPSWPPILNMNIHICHIPAFLSSLIVNLLIFIYLFQPPHYGVSGEDTPVVRSSDDMD